MSDRYDRQAALLAEEWRAGWHDENHPVCGPPLTDLSARIAAALRAAVAEEREAAAKIAQEKCAGGSCDLRVSCAPCRIAARIRARGEETPDAL